MIKLRGILACFLGKEYQAGASWTFFFLPVTVISNLRILISLLGNTNSHTGRGFFGVSFSARENSYKASSDEPQPAGLRAANLYHHQRIAISILKILIITEDFKNEYKPYHHNRNRRRL